MSPPVVEHIEDRPWERVWLDEFAPTRFGRRLWVCPRGQAPDPAEIGPDTVIVELDPGLAFGTGHHATTALCLEWLDALDLTGKTVLDYGCGSGILAIAALRLGAALAVAVDHDPQALEATRDNAAENGVADRIQVYAPEDQPRLTADVLVANILAGPLVELAPRLAELVAPGGALALSGVLEEQAPEVAAAYSPHFDLDPTASAGRLGPDLRPASLPMPLTTRCRHCGRLFPVYATQLKANRARVPCPQCGKRFDAVAGLIDEHIPTTDDGGRLRHPAHRTSAVPLTTQVPGLEPPERRRARAGLARGPGRVRTQPGSRGPGRLVGTGGIASPASGTRGPDEAMPDPRMRGPSAAPAGDHRDPSIDPDRRPEPAGRPAPATGSGQPRGGATTSPGAAIGTLRPRRVPAGGAPLRAA